jgi:aminodeoxychorismate synthase component I
MPRNVELHFIKPRNSAFRDHTKSYCSHIINTNAAAPGTPFSTRICGNVTAGFAILNPTRGDRTGLQARHRALSATVQAADSDPDFRLHILTMFARELILDFDGRRLRGARPFARFEAKEGTWTWHYDAARPSSVLPFRSGRGDVLAHLQSALQWCRAHRSTSGAAIGFWSYDFARQWEPRAFAQPGAAASPSPQDDLDIPDVRLDFCHALSSETLPTNAAVGMDDTQVQAAQSTLEEPDVDYCNAIAKIRDYIAAGDIYQANLTRRFRAPLPCSPKVLYERLLAAHPMPFSALLDWPDLSIVSNSPERFVRLHGRELLTQPIKGTTRRGRTVSEDEKQREALQHSEKDRAENVMIVDLLRNDLGHVCEYGSVQVPQLWQIESFPTLHHLVSTVTGTLRPECDAIDALKVLFPCGSITGAPKMRAMQILDALEPVRRGVAMGAIGYFGFGGDMEWNVAIRTITCRNEQAFWHAGGGIVWDSDAQSEWRELQLKASAIRAALAPR